ncbi:MAG: hypothetical protein AB1746_05915 [Candidatus Zixiibacteriota bacterium]
MNMLKSFLKHPLIQVALVAGICIIIQSYFYKKVLNLQLDTLIVAIPAFIYTIFGGVSSAKNNRTIEKFARPVYWMLAIIIATALSIIIPYLNRS